MSEEIDLTPVLVRRILRDVMPEEQLGSLFEMFDLVPAGPEVDAIEQRESNYRVAACLPVHQHIEVYSTVLAHIVSKFLATRLPGGSPDDETWMQHFEAQNLTIIRASLWATLGGLLSTSVLGYGEAVYRA